MLVNLSQELIEKIAKELLNKKQTVAVAESVTSGMLQLAFSGGDKASEFYEGGITAYNINQKCEHLGVDRAHAKEVNCVSQKVSDEMATGIATLYGSHWGIAVTGYATPVPESGNVLFAYFSISFSDVIIASGKISSNDMPAENVQGAYCEYILKRFHNLLSEQAH